MLVRGFRRPARIGLVSLVSLITVLSGGLGWLAATAAPAAAASVITVTGHDFTVPQGVDALGHLFVSGATPVVVTFTDSNAQVTVSDLSGSINWGDGTTSSATITALGGPFGASGSHIYAATGTFTVSVTITDATSPGSGSGTAQATVTPQLAVTVNPVTIAEGASFSGAIATFTDAVSQPASDLSATIAWGDGTTTTGTIVLAGQSGTVSGSHAWAEDGSDTVQVTVTASNPVDASATGTATATVSEADLTATPTAIHPVAGTALTAPVGTFTDTGSPDPASSFTASIGWGDGTAATVGTIAGSSGTFTVTGTHTYASAGTFTLTLGITEVGAGTATATESVVVTAAATTTTTTRSTTTTSTTSTTSTTIASTTTAAGAATVAPTTTTATGALPVTGGDFEDIVAVALGLLVVGAATVAVTRRARR
jgi:hypothetical protein